MPHLIATLLPPSGLEFQHINVGGAQTFGSQRISMFTSYTTLKKKKKMNKTLEREEHVSCARSAMNKKSGRSIYSRTQIKHH